MDNNRINFFSSSFFSLMDVAPGYERSRGRCFRYLKKINRIERHLRVEIGTMCTK